MKHFDEIKIDGFRGIKDASFKKLSEINLFVGNNNSGKTSALEAIELFTNPLSKSNILSVSRSRDRYNLNRGKLDKLESIKWMFPINNKDRESISLSSILKQTEVKLTMNIEESTEYHVNNDTQQESFDLQDVQEYLYAEEQQEEILIQKLNVKVNLYKDGISSNKDIQFREKELLRLGTEEDNTIIPSNFISPIDHRVRPFSIKELNDVILSGDRPKIIKALQYFDKNIIGIEFLMPKSGPIASFSFIPYINHKKLGLVPVTMFGDGLKKALTISSGLIRSQNGILLIDELETGIHTTLLGQFFSWLVNACREFKVQLFATTHSLEAIDAILNANNNNIKNISAYRLELNEDNTQVKRFPGETLNDLRNQLGQDIR